MTIFTPLFAAMQAKNKGAPGRWLWLALGLAAAAHLLLWPTAPLMMQAVGALLLSALAPGLLLVDLLVGRSSAPPPWWERLLYSIGAGYSNLVLILLGISYLPGGVTRSQLFTFYDLWLLLLAILWLWLPVGKVTADPTTAQWPEVRSHPANTWIGVGMLVLALVGGCLRFTDLGYAEFQGDEARLALHAAEIIQGYESALFVHKKGPVEILLPTVIYAFSNHLTETTARLPFALASFTALFGALLLGWRLFGPVAGWSAALLLALDGYLVAFGRVLQYQSVVLLMVLLVVLLLHRLYYRPYALGRYLTLTALLLATGLLAHYEASLVIIPTVYLLWQVGQKVGWVKLLRAAIIPALVGAAILASFYLPYMRYPDFSDTQAYLVDYRLGLGGTYNHLSDFFMRTTLYSSTYYLLLLIALATVALLQGIWRRLTQGWAWLATILLLGGLAATFYRPNWLLLGMQDLTWLFFLGAIVGGWLWAAKPEERLLWLWFGGPLIIALFFTAIPNTHVYSAFTGWALLAGMVAQRGWAALHAALSRHSRAAGAMAVVLAGALVFLFGNYEYQLFVRNDVEVLRTWPAHRPWGYWTAYTMPEEIAIFGFPLRNGWKAVAGLYADGVLTGPYATNSRDVVAEWYTRGAGYCARDEPNYYILVNPVEPTLADETTRLRQQLLQDHALWATVQINGHTGLEIYGKQGLLLQGQDQVKQIAYYDYANKFDATYSTPAFERNGPVGNPAIQHEIHQRLGDTIWLQGYRLGQATVTPGQSLPLTLYWQSTQHPAADYHTFVQVIELTDARKAGQRDGQPGCNRYPTSTWAPGAVIADHYDIPIAADAQPGDYSLLVGMVKEDGSRLPVFTAQDEAAGDSIVIGTVTVGLR
ncbi:MAG: glycosyltransferase family 39 protein [Caldilineaceae bacterium]